MPGLRRATTWAAPRWMRALVMSAPALLLAAWCDAATLRPGDVVLANNYSGLTLIALLDPATLDTTLVSYGFGTIVRGSAVGVAVDRSGRILVADRNSGIVHVDAQSGAQSVLVDAASLGGNPAGLCVAPEGHVFVSVRGATPGVMRVSSDGSTVTPLTGVGEMAAPGGLTFGPDGALYVTDEYLPHDNGEADGVPGHGSIVRLDAATGALTLVAADSTFIGPFDIAFVSPDRVWTTQRGWVAGRRASSRRGSATASPRGPTRPRTAGPRGSRWRRTEPSTSATATRWARIAPRCSRYGFQAGRSSPGSAARWPSCRRTWCPRVVPPGAR